MTNTIGAREREASTEKGLYAHRLSLRILWLSISAIFICKPFFFLFKSCFHESALIDLGLIIVSFLP